MLFSFGEKYGTYALNLLSAVILARLLSPSEFGLFGVGMSVVMLIEVFRDFGVGNYLIQEREITRSSVRTAFTMTMAVSLLCSGALLAAAGPVAAFYGEPGLERIFPLFAANFLLLPFAVPSTNLLRRDLAFGSLAGINLLGAVVNFGAVIALALLGHGAMSLAWATLLGSAVRTLGAFACRPHFWAFRPTFRDWRKIASFGGWSTAAAVINVLHDALPQLILGRVLGLGAVGLFGRATTLCQLPDRLITSALQPVLLPALAERVRQAGDLKAWYLLALAHMTVLQWPMLLCLALLADPIVALLLGGQWTEVAPLVRLIALGSLWLFPAFMTYPLMVALGRIRDTLTMSLISLPPSIAVIFGASFFGLEAVAAAQFVNAPLQVLVALHFIRRQLELSWREIAVAIRPGALVAACAAAVPAAAVASAGFRFDLPVPVMLLSLVGAAAGWSVGLAITGHPFLAEVRGAARAVRHRVHG